MRVMDFLGLYFRHLSQIEKYIDFNTGTIAYYKKLLVGFSIHHITEPDFGLQGINKLPIRYGLQIGYHIMVNKIIYSPASADMKH